MDKWKMKVALSQRKKQVNEFLSELENEGLKLSKTSYYRKINGIQEFTAKEIKFIAKVLELSKDEMNEIFFGELVS